MEGITLKIVTPDGVAFDGEVKSLLVRTTEGDVGILRGHTNYVACIDYGMVKIVSLDGTSRVASCMNGFVSVGNNLVRIVATTYEFADEIDVSRAERAKERAEKLLAEKRSADDIALAQMKLKRALNRINVSHYVK
ncbi:MAG: ATP synthase F1 subunit epsilon [Clostridia bacterium]|nr:ATP synthase F1 subunit epsilon [Clostridia bacterium]